MSSCDFAFLRFTPFYVTLYGKVELQIIFDTERDHYQLVHIGGALTLSDYGECLMWKGGHRLKRQKNSEETQ